MGDGRYEYQLHGTVCFNIEINVVDEPKKKEEKTKKKKNENVLEAANFSSRRRRMRNKNTTCIHSHCLGSVLFYLKSIRMNTFTDCFCYGQMFSKKHPKYFCQNTRTSENIRHNKIYLRSLLFLAFSDFSSIPSLDSFFILPLT